MNRAKWKVAAVLTGMFLLGAVCGGAVMRASTNRELSVMLDAPPAEARQQLRLRALTRKLGLSEEQRRRVAEALRTERARCQPVQERAEADLAECRQRARAAVDDVLTPEQRERLDRIIERRARRGNARP